MSKNTFFRVHNDASQRERRAVAENDRRGSTYHAHAVSEADTVGGRYAAESKQRVVGSRPLIEYPALPTSSPWHCDPVPDEPPLNQDVNVVEPVGTAQEIAHSMREADAGADPPSELPEPALPGDERSAAVASSAPSPSKRRGRLAFSSGARNRSNE